VPAMTPEPLGKPLLQAVQGLAPPWRLMGDRAPPRHIATHHLAAAAQLGGDPVDTPSQRLRRSITATSSGVRINSRVNFSWTAQRNDLTLQSACAKATLNQTPSGLFGRAQADTSLPRPACRDVVLLQDRIPAEPHPALRR